MIKWLYLLTLAVWIGSIVFFSFIVAPQVFKTLGAEEAGRLIRKLFSRYYMVGVVCAGVGIVGVGILLADGALTKWPAILSLVLLAGMGGASLWMREAVLPHMNELRDEIYAARAQDKPAEPAIEREWKALHRMSVLVNLAVLLCAAALVWIVVFARAG
jgi:uncharacterized membrane protein